MVGAYPDEVDPNTLRYAFSPQKYIPGIQMKFPMHESIASDWELMEKLWDFSLEQCLKVDLAGLPVLMAEKPFNTPELRQK